MGPRYPVDLRAGRRRRPVRGPALVAVAAKVDWPRFTVLVTSDSSVAALVLSLQTAAASTVLCVLLGVPMAMVLARSPSRSVRAVRPVILLPLVLPRWSAASHCSTPSADWD